MIPMLIISGSTRLVPLADIPIGGLFTDHNGKVWMRGATQLTDGVTIPIEFEPCVSMEKGSLGLVANWKLVPENRVAPVNSATFTIGTQGDRELGQ